MDAVTGVTIPLWNYRILSPVDNNWYEGVMVGKSPFESGPGDTTVVPTVLIPVVLTFTYASGTSYTFDPGAPDPGCLGTGNTALSLTQQSPLVNDATFIMGGTFVGYTQYSDAFQRANFWSTVQTKGQYRTLLGVATLPPQVVTVPSTNTGRPQGTVYAFANQCGTNTGDTNLPGYLGVMDINFWDPLAQSLIQALGITSTTFPIFLFYNAVMSEDNPTTLNNCCILGYHNAVGSPVQTYGVGAFDGRNQTLLQGTADTSILSHEVAEWLTDPLTNNLTPAWGHLGQQPGCQNNLEVGDPLSGTLLPSVPMPNGFTYHLQELAFFSWFYRQQPSMGVNGWYSDQATFSSDAGAVCH